MRAKISSFKIENMADDSSFKTPSRPPKKARIESKTAENLYSPMKIPPSPMMKKLGCGTGVIVYRLERELFSPLHLIKKSPWAVKKAKKTKQEAVKRLKIESEILKKLNHSNIISYRYKILKLLAGLNSFLT